MIHDEPDDDLEVEQPIENEEVAEVNPIEELIDAIAQQNFNQAKSHFEDVLGDKMNDALEAEKLSVAQSIYNDAEESEEDFDLEDVEDDDLDDADEGEEEEVEEEDPS